MDPLFNSMMFRPQFADHSWISDTMTFCPDSKLLWQNAALSLQLTNMHSFYYNQNPYPQMDMGSLLPSIWNNAYQAANASLASSLSSYAAMPNIFTGFTPTIPTITQTQTQTTPLPKADLTDAQKTDFAVKQTEFNALMEKYGETNINKEIAKKLGIDTALAKAKAAFSKADTPEKIEDCIDNFILEMSEVAAKKSVDELQSVLPIQYSSDEFIADIECKVQDLYVESSDFESKIYNLICGSTPVIDVNNVVEEMNTRQGKSCLIDELTHRYHDKGGYWSENWDDDKYIQVVETLVDVLKNRSMLANARSQETSSTRAALSDAFGKYKKNTSKSNREALVTAYINLYNAVRKAEATKNDSKNKTFVKTLPEAYHDVYLDEKGELKPEFKYPVENEGFILKGKDSTVGATKEETVEKTEKKENVKKEEATEPVSTTTQMSNTTSTTADDEVDGVTGAARVADNMPKVDFEDKVEDNFWSSLFMNKY